MVRPRLIDLTRSLRRAGRGLTGVDRVERAYLQHFLDDGVPVYGLVRTPLGYLVLDRVGMVQFLKRLERQAEWGRISLLSHLSRHADKIVKSAESDLRRFAIARTRRAGLAGLLLRVMGSGFDYYNVGHSNLTNRVLRDVAEAGGMSHVMIHDVIPIEYPQYQRPGTSTAFEDKLRRVGVHAARVIYNSQDTRMRTERILNKWGRVPDGIVSHLGTITPVAVPAEVPHGLAPKGPYFVVLGTIEPRKNHAFLLDIWDQLGPNAPALLICGSRGWNNRDVFDRLDTLPADTQVTEHANLSDGAVAELVKNSAGLLFPSYAEGFGLPPVEALGLGARVLCNDLEVLHEILHKKPVYASISDVDLWLDTIIQWANNPQTAQGSVDFSGPSWADHFKTVLR